VLRIAGETRRATGNENAGFLSESHGLLPISPPLTRLPDSHMEWDEAASQLPALFRTMRAREYFDDLPVLRADAHHLADPYLLRACALLGIFAHSYVRARPGDAGELPAGIIEPWRVVCDRLERDRTELTYDDLVAYNWRFTDGGSARRVEDLELLVPTVGNAAEQVFYLAQVEILAEGAPIVAGMARAQQAARRRDWSNLTAELTRMIESLEHVGVALDKVDPNPYSPTHVDPVMWAKTVAPFSVAICPAGRPVSGPATPLFQLLDVFIGRKSYDTRVGRESIKLRPSFSPNVRAFLSALDAVPVADLVAQSGDSELLGTWRCLMEAYVGEHGFLGVHRRKAYAYLSVAFKVGREVTTGGFTGVFTEQTWETAHRELELARQERLDGQHLGCPMLSSDAVTLGDLHGDATTHLRLDTQGLGLHVRPGDRLAVRPQNCPDTVARVLTALRATGEEVVPVDKEWQAELGISAPAATMRTVVERGAVRRVGRDVAQALLALTDNERLRRITHARAEETWELHSLLEMLTAAGLDPRQVWQAHLWEPHAIARIVRPEPPRLYSASVRPNRPCPNEFELMVRPVRYEVGSSELTVGGARQGAATAYLNLVGAEGSATTGVPLTVSGGRRFRPPRDPDRPIVMIAGGVGVAPFRYFLADRGGRRGHTADWLFVTTRNPAELDALRIEFDRAIQAGELVLTGRITDGRPTADGTRGIASLIAEHGDAIESLLADGESAAHVYICGSAGFASTATKTLEMIVGVDRVCRLIGAGRLSYDVFTVHASGAAPMPKFDLSEIARHNDEANGYWTIIDDLVYDMTTLAHHHPGGMAILHEVAGSDATAAFHTIGHHKDLEIVARLDMYRIGRVRAVDLMQIGGVTVGAGGLNFVLLADVHQAWIHMLHLAVQVQNAVRHDFSALDHVTVAGENPTDMTWLKAHMLLDAHERFLQTYIPALAGDGLTDLWDVTAGLCAPSLDVRTLPDAMSAIASGGFAAAAADTRRWRKRLPENADSCANPADLETFAELRDRCRHLDQRLISEVKAAYADGVAQFERHGQTVIRAGGSNLVNALTSVVSSIQTFHQDIRSVFDDGLVVLASETRR
jgi:sulfite reductase (NADPH) flavoprotein alpha-component